jgi:ribosomal protein S18 acetylase RimI-like enzyme
VSDVEISRAGRGRIAEVEILWRALHAHHASVAGHLAGVAPFRSEDDSWERRRGHYERVLAEPGSFLLLAERDGRPVGYAAVRLSGTEATLVVGERVAELETLSVLPEERGNGLGGLLMDAVYAELRALGIEELGVAVMAGNDRALAFYERRGFVPYLRLMLGRVPPAA